MSDRFDRVDKRFDRIEGKFGQVEGKITTFKNEVFDKLDEHTKDIKKYFDYSIGVMRDKFMDDIKYNNDHFMGLMDKRYKRK